MGWAPKSAEPLGEPTAYITQADGVVRMWTARCMYCCEYIWRRPLDADKRWKHDRTGITYCAENGVK